MHLQIIWCITYNVVWGLALHFSTTVTKRPTAGGFNDVDHPAVTFCPNDQQAPSPVPLPPLEALHFHGRQQLKAPIRHLVYHMRCGVGSRLAPLHLATAITKHPHVMDAFNCVASGAGSDHGEIFNLLTSDFSLDSTLVKPLAGKQLEAPQIVCCITYRTVWSSTWHLATAITKHYYLLYKPVGP